MDPLHGIRGGERQRASDHLVEGDAQRVEIAAGVDRPVHAAGLLRRHIGERPGDHLRRRRRLAFARQPGRHAKAGEPDVAGRVDEDVRRPDVLVDKAMLMDLAKRRRQRHGNGQKARQRKRAPKHPFQQFAPDVLKHDHAPPVAARDRQGPHRPRRIKIVGQRIFVFEPAQVRRRLLGAQRRQHQDRRGVAMLAASV
jgi:hypothetical protein